MSTNAPSYGGSAFPFVMPDPSAYHTEPGMTLRDYFAGIALQAILTQRHGLVGATCADDAYVAADKMLVARQKPPTP